MGGPDLGEDGDVKKRRDPSWKLSREVCLCSTSEDEEGLNVSGVAGKGVTSSIGRRALSSGMGGRSTQPKYEGLTGAEGGVRAAWGKDAPTRQRVEAAGAPLTRKGGDEHHGGRAIRAG